MSGFRRREFLGPRGFAAGLRKHPFSGATFRRARDGQAEDLVRGEICMTSGQVGKLPPDHSRVAVPVKDRPGVHSAHGGKHELKADGWHLCLDGSPRLGLFVYPYGLFVTKKVIQALDPQRFSDVEERRFSLELGVSFAQFDSHLSLEFGVDSISRDVYQHPDPNVIGEIRHYSFSREDEESVVERIRKRYMA